MENASKALIIAGAILLAIAIIGVGMYVFGNARDAVSDTGLTDQQADSYNQKFTNYAGTQRGSNVKTMCNTIANHNRTASDDSEVVAIVYDSTATGEKDATEVAATASSESYAKDTADITSVRDDDIQSGASYTITFNYDSTSGKVTEVHIKEI